MRYTYWTCSKFAEWLRGTKYPHAVKWGEWDEICAAAKAAHPIRYWLADTGIRFCQNVVYFVPEKINSLRHYLRNRFVNRTHLLNTRLTPGGCYDCDTIILHGLMETLVDYVEIECASWTEGNKGRSEEDGLKRLAWERSLVSESPESMGKRTPQAIAADEVRELYSWWKDTRPNRADPWEKLSEEHIIGDYENTQKLEDQYQEEDDEMLCRLIKIRHSMWT